MEDVILDLAILSCYSTAVQFHSGLETNKRKTSDSKRTEGLGTKFLLLETLMLKMSHSRHHH